MVDDIKSPEIKPYFFQSNSEEVEALQQEFKWVLKEEVTAIFAQLNGIIFECGKRLSSSFLGNDCPTKSEKYHLDNSTENTQDHLKALVTIQGDNISHADISLKLHSFAPHRTIVQNECPWKLQQIQDASNHLSSAHYFLSNYLQLNKDHTAEEVVQIINSLMGFLHRGRTCLVNPKKKSMEDIKNNKNMKSLQPPLPPEMAISFYIQSHKLTFAVYTNQKSGGAKKFNISHVDCSIPWLNEVLVLFSIGLQLCQQLKDKILIFAQYQEMDKGCA